MSEHGDDEVTNCEEADVTKMNKPELTKCAQALQTLVKQIKDQHQTAETDKHNLDQQLTTAKQDKDQLEIDNKKLLSDLAQVKNERLDLVKELDVAHAQVSELKTEKNELLELVGSQSTSDNASPPAKVFLIVDKNISELKDHVGDGALWDYCEVKSLVEVYDIVKHSRDKLQSFDLIIIVLGSQDILDLHKSAKEIRVGQQGQRVFVQLLDVVKKLKDLAPVTVVQIPPLNNPKMFTDVTLYNYKIQSASFGDNVSIIVDDKVSDIPRSKMVKKDSCVSLSAYGAEVFGNLIQSQMSIPEPREKQSNPAESKDEYCHFMKVPNSMTGALIGEDGVTIQSITYDTKVKIAVGSWCERRKRPKNAPSTQPPPKPIERHGILITGIGSNIKAAQKRVAAIMDAEEAKRLKSDVDI